MSIVSKGYMAGQCIYWCVSLFWACCVPYAEIFNPSKHLKFRIAYLQNHLGDWGSKGAIICHFIKSNKQKICLMWVVRAWVLQPTTYSNCIPWILVWRPMICLKELFLTKLAAYSDLVVSCSMCRSWFSWDLMGFPTMSTLL